MPCQKIQSSADFTCPNTRIDKSQEKVILCVRGLRNKNKNSVPCYFFFVVTWTEIGKLSNSYEGRFSARSVLKNLLSVTMPCLSRNTWHTVYFSDG